MEQPKTGTITGFRFGHCGIHEVIAKLTYPTVPSCTVNNQE